MSAFHIRAYEPSDEDAVIGLWRACGLVFSQNDPKRDIERKLKVNPEWFLVGLIDGLVIGTCMAGYEGHRGWINYLAVHPDHQRRGLARRLMEHVESLLRAAGCPKINLQVRGTNKAVIAFYERLGFTEDAVISLGRRLEHDDPALPPPRDAAFCGPCPPAPRFPPPPGPR